MLVLSAPASAQISGDTIKIGLVVDLSSLYADVTGSGSVEAVKMAIADMGGWYDSHPHLFLRRPYDCPGLDMRLSAPVIIFRHCTTP